jgi:hypothetical protein
MALTIPILTRKSFTDFDPLTYKAKELAAGQRRLNCRWVVYPNIDLSKFACRAVVDWVEIHFTTILPTHFRDVRRVTAYAFGGKKPWIEPVKSSDPTEDHLNPPRTSHIFALRVQEPDCGEIAAALKAVDKKYALNRIPCVAAIEVSIDFTPKTPCDRHRSAMVLLLGRHLQPAPHDVISRKNDRPRFSWGVRKGDWMFYGSENEVTNRDIIPLHTVGDHTARPGRGAPSFAGGDQPTYADATLYFGQRGGPVMWRVMDKVKDRQNRKNGTATILPLEERRARIEVELRGSALDDLGINDFPKLLAFRFEKLSRFFQFVLPTFSEDAPPKPNDPAAWASRRRWSKFEVTGVVGLDAMDSAKRNEVRRTRSALARTKLPLRNRERAGKGSRGSFVAYKELNKAVDTSLRHLAGRVSRQVRLVSSS